MGRSVETIAARSAKGYLDSSAALAILLAIAAGAGSARALDQGRSPLGKVEFANSCAAGAQPELNQAMALLHHMSYPRANAAFAQVADEAALQQLERLRATAHLNPTFKTAFHLSSIPARYAHERRAWHDAAGLDPDPPRRSRGTASPGRRA